MAFTNGRNSVSASFSAAPQQSAPLQVDKNERFTISATFPGGTTGSVEFQRTYDGGVTWKTVEAAYTASTEKDGIAAEAMEIRLACTVLSAGGPIAARLGK